MIDLKGKVALVTGGGGGIGAATVRQIVQLGGSVVLHDVKAEGAAAKVKADLGDACLVVAGDLAQDDAPTSYSISPTEKCMSPSICR